MTDEDRPTAEYTNTTPLGEPDNRQPAVRVEIGDGYWDTMSLEEAREFQEEFEAAIEKAERIADGE